ncbi:hypothetical protein SteCoe_25868 [Stentor coeruleus]|uniref:Tyrosine-protein kinase ephrin type A/B receptor-like domain-containing protein n=1 Tax=Stentor coeruleus TaxID=5963 RepID=A0A1R2BEF6_9CILI|nr:hypothetical protein SteCoe_25868 [Stentor coeruleus]
MWKYDMINNYWSFVSMQGTVPSPRASFSCIQPNGETMILFGGKDSTNVYGDIYAYSADQDAWITLDSSTVGPAPRYDSCISQDSLQFYIIGGQNVQNTFSDIWNYDYIKEKFNPVAKFISFSIKKHKCWANKENGVVVINVIGGSTFEDYPNYNWYQVKILEDSYEESIKLSSAYLGYSDIALAVAEEHFYIIFGCIWDKLVTSSVTKVNLVSGEITVFSFSDDTGVYGHSVCHWKDTFFIFGGGKSRNNFKIKNSASNDFLKIENSESSPKIECGKGTILPDCAPCNAGEYYQDNLCIPCPKGRFSINPASIGEEQCIQCAAGTFSDKEGSTYCLDCSYGYFCPLGSIKPVQAITGFAKSESHPGIYIRKTNFVLNTVYQMMIIACLACGVVTIGILLVKNLWVKIESIDLFVKKHPNDLGLPVVLRKTSLGGLFTIFFLLLTLATLIGSILTYHFDNITEIKSLIPSIMLNYDIKASFFKVESIFYTYGGVCLVNEACHPNIKVAFQGLYFTKMIKTCTKIEEDTCKIVIEFSEFYVDSSQSYITLQLEEKNSYAGYFTINTTSSSSIPESFSSVFIPVEPPSYEYIFKGSNPTLIYFKLIPSLFTSQSSRWKDLDTGYHLQSDKDITIGSVATQKMIKMHLYLYVQIVLSKSESGLNTQRIINNSLFSFVSGLLGSIFGLMSSISSVMAMTEIFAERYYKKIKLEKNFQNALIKNKMLKCEFGNCIIKCRNKKVLPLSETED